MLAVEPFFDNIIRFHKAVEHENLQDRVTLITNAISDRRNEIKLLEKMEDNIGGQSLLKSGLANESFTKADRIKNKYLVETIVFDDIVEFLPRKNKNTRYEKAIMKIDIEGFEPFAFAHAHKLFASIDVRVIFMEWGRINSAKTNRRLITQMIDFLASLSYEPMADNVVLNTTNWETWPWDLIWLRK